MLNIPDQNGIFHNCSCQTSSIFDPFAGISQFVRLAVIHEKRTTTPSILYNSVGFVLIACREVNISSSFSVNQKC
ncbi:hypothetical protein T12_6825 [Trichinella patagoniensis]|uniref:Uncharacterized protein n=1 Tax=Trichinella patagoniensis TaxID=990121 RepID=A0A0V0YWS9_9BILA|nr:hypothetical protein T12_6825 [Trichinella patagoniensis]